MNFSTIHLQSKIEKKKKLLCPKSLIRHEFWMYSVDLLPILCCRQFQMSVSLQHTGTYLVRSLQFKIDFFVHSIECVSCINHYNWLMHVGTHLLLVWFPCGINFVHHFNSNTLCNSEKFAVNTSFIIWIDDRFNAHCILNQDYA